MIKMPSAFQVSDCVRKLTRREATVTVLAKPAAAKLAYAGTFHSGDRAVIAMCAADVAFAGYTGAALAMIPADSAQERVRSGVLDEMMQENFAEVLNVLSRIFVVPETERMTLLKPIFPPCAVPARLEPSVAFTSILRADYEIDIDGYGVGHLALWGLG
ncbi:MAG: hypothetical protein EOO79_07050 [Oxalobacteraceae bacterium]|nr:MAG: hypothetical protein EOO79_07050 [Oxalobacteraceae bacterium]